MPLRLVTLSLLAAGWIRPAAPDAFRAQVQPFLKRNCYGCHNPANRSGNLDLQVFQTTASVQADPPRWDRILQRMKSGEMPPPPLPRPQALELRAATTWIAATVDAAERRAQPDPGPVMARRLNRSEYNNTIRDLLALDLDAASDFAEDNSAYGFDNIAEALSIAPLQMEKYLAAAERISQLAVFGPEIKKPSTVRFTPTLPRRQETNPVQLTEPAYFTPQDYDATGLSHQGSFHKRHRFPATGEYIIRVFPNGSRPNGSEPQSLEVFLDGKLAQQFTVRQLLTETNESMPVAHEFRLKLTAGYHEIAAGFPRLFEGLPPAYQGPNPSKLAQPPPRDPSRFFPPAPKDATPQQIAEREARIARFRERLANPKFDGVAVGVVEIVGPFEHVQAPLAEARAKVFVCPQQTDVCEQTILRALARRAYRRPVAAVEVRQLQAIAADARRRGRSFEQGIALALQTMLVTPDFLFRLETARPARAGAAPVLVEQYELASRLSYFLWSSMPDEELLQHAARGTLRQPAVLRAQTTRMLRDPKAQAFVRNFIGQWLETRRLEGVQPDRDRFPDFDDHLRASMIRETELFFGNLLAQDGSSLDLLEGEYTFVDERLARHYKIPDVRGQEFRRVSLAGTGRAGILTHASVLTVSSYNNRTSPVLRGKWILENLLNAPPPPPPPNVPALDEAAVGATGTLRQQMEKHRANAVCASCHARMDPLGFALENYNAVGLWRTQDGKFAIDPAGALPDGRAIQGPQDLKTVLAADREAFTLTLAEKLLVYALGRGTQPADRVTIKKSAREAAAGRYRMSSLILGVVNSVPFQMQRGAAPKS